MSLLGGGEKMLKSKDFKVLFESANSELARLQAEKFNQSHNVTKANKDIAALNRKINELKGALGRLGNTVFYAKKHNLI
jgi:predicted  nucleic acid-binding Zn-ribbon protein